GGSGQRGALLRIRPIARHHRPDARGELRPHEGVGLMRIVQEGRLVSGMQLTIQAQSSVFVEEWERDAGPDELARLARAADACGFFYVAVCDHVAIPERLAPAMGTT